MLFYKYISIILHPVVIPTIGVMLYFLVIPGTYFSNQKFTILSYVFILTYLIPLFMMIFLKRLKLIKSYRTESVNERKLPVILMIFLFYILANSLESILLLKDLSLLFYASSFGLAMLFIFLFRDFKMSIHLLALGISTGFFIALSDKYGQSFLLVIMALIIISGFLASARLHLKAHSVKEVFSGFFTGILAVMAIYLYL